MSQTEIIGEKIKIQAKIPRRKKGAGNMGQKQVIWRRAEREF